MHETIGKNIIYMEIPEEYYTTSDKIYYVSLEFFI